MEPENQQSQSGAFYRMIAAGIVTVFFAIYSVIEPDYKYLSMWTVVIGAVGTWGLYLAWRRKRDRHGLDLLDEDDS